jgi:hypothetical protein
MRRIALAFVTGMLATVPAAGQTPAPPAESLQLEMRGALRMLATAQQAYYAEHRTFTVDVNALRMMPGMALSPTVQLAIWTASPDGWAMESRHPMLPGQSCVYYMGKPGTIPEVLTLEKRLPGSARSGRVTCDFDVSR